MVDDELYVLLAKMRDFYGGLATELDNFIGTKTKEVTKTADVKDIVWTKKTGAKGPFQLCDSKLNMNNENYKTLLRDLKASNGTKRIGGKFYWVFTDGANIGRK